MFTPGWSYYRDEQYYIECGVFYVSNLTPPLMCNFEHPPFAKYFIGFFSVLGIARYVFMLLAVVSGFLLYLLVSGFTGYWIAGLVVSTLFLFDTIVFNTHRYLLLDPVAVFLVLLSTCLFYSGRKYISAITAGLAVASKFSVVPVVAGLWLTLVIRERGFKNSILYLLLAFATYLSTYLVDLRLGLDAILRHHVEMYTYMSWRHGFSPVIAILGFTKLFFRIEAWRYIGEYTFLVSTSNGFLEVVNTKFTPLNKWYIVFYAGGGSPLWHILFPSLLYATYLVLTRKASSRLGDTVFLSWLSLLNVVAGTLDWYYVNTLPFLYTTLVVLVYQVAPSRFKWIVTALVIVHFTSFILTLLGVIPFKTLVAT